MKLETVMDITEVPLYKQLRIKRVLEGKTQAELSRQLNISQPALSKYELNFREIQDNDYQTIIDYLEK